VSDNRLPKIKLEKLDLQHKAMVETLLQVAPERMTPWFAKRFAKVYGDITKQSHREPLVMQTMLQYLADKVDLPFIDRCCRQLLGRTNELESGPLLPFVKPIQLEWVPFEIVSLSKATWNENKPGQLMTVYCLAGSPAGHRLPKKLPEAWLRFIAYKIGYTRKINYPDDEPWQLIGLRFWGLVIPVTEERSTLDFSDWAIDAQMKKSNAGIIAKRNRHLLDDPEGPTAQECDEDPDLKVPKHACPLRLDHYCSACPHTLAACEASIHRERFSDRRRSQLDAKASRIH